MTETAGSLHLLNRHIRQVRAHLRDCLRWRRATLGRIDAAAAARPIPDSLVNAVACGTASQKPGCDESPEYDRFDSSFELNAH